MYKQLIIRSLTYFLTSGPAFRHYCMVKTSLLLISEDQVRSRKMPGQEPFPGKVGPAGCCRSSALGQGPKRFRLQGLFVHRAVRSMGAFQVANAHKEFVHDLAACKTKGLFE